MLSKLTFFIPLIGRRWRMVFQGAHLHWARLCGTAGYNHSSMTSLGWSTMSCPQLMLGTSQIMGSSLASFYPSLLPWIVIFLFSLTVCSLWSGTQVLGTLVWRGFVSQSCSVKWNWALILAMEEIGDWICPVLWNSGVDPKTHVVGMLEWMSHWKRKKHGTQDGDMGGILLVEMDPTGRQSSGII